MCCRCLLCGCTRTAVLSQQLEHPVQICTLIDTCPTSSGTTRVLQQWQIRAVYMLWFVFNQLKQMTRGSMLPGAGHNQLMNRDRLLGEAVEASNVQS